MEQKPFWLSKTFWLNVIGGLVILIQTQTGFIIGPEEQAGIMVVLNVIVRFLTKSAMTIK